MFLSKNKFKLTLFFLIIALSLLIFLAIYFLFYKNLKQKEILSKGLGYNTPPLLVQQDHKPVCLQLIDKSGWEIINNQIVTYPRCLTVMNSRLGSRFNFDWYFGDQKVKSRPMGNMQDFDSNFVLRIFDQNNSWQLFPLQNNSQNPKVSSKLGLTYQEISYNLEDLILKLTIHSPFLPNQSPDDENFKISSAPFFYLDIEVINKSLEKINKSVSIALGDYQKNETRNGLNIIYYSDPIDPGAKRALAFDKNNDNQFEIYKNSAGIKINFNLDPNQNHKESLIYAGFTNNNVMVKTDSGVKKNLFFYYTKWFKDIDAVLDFAKNNQDKIEKETQEFETSFATNPKLDPQEKWLAAQAFHSYIGNSWYVYNPLKEDEVYYYVWEGEFKYLNTLDVAHDYAVLEGMYFPWVIKSELKSWQKSAKTDLYGTVIPHDLGINFNPSGTQGYKIPGWETSGMPVEENLNFIILSYWYFSQTNDKKFIEEISPFIYDLVLSLKNRDKNNNGIADVGLGMTTYDSDSNSSLKEAPDSTYIGLKQLVAYVMADKIFEITGNKNNQYFVNLEARLISESLTKTYQQLGFVPLTLDPKFEEKDLFDNKKVKGIDNQGFTYISGLFYPALLKLDSPYLKDFLPIIAKSYGGAYEKSLIRNKNQEVTGLQLVQYQSLNLGWFSHSIMADYISEKLLGLSEFDSWQVFFPRIYDSPYGFADGHYFREPFNPPQLCLLYYPRGVTIFAFLKD